MLPKHRIYYYTQKRVFGDEPDSVHAFVMPGYNIGMHVQEFHEINIVIKGSGVHYSEERPSVREIQRKRACSAGA